MNVKPVFLVDGREHLSTWHAAPKDGVAITSREARASVIRCLVWDFALQRFIFVFLEPKALLPIPEIHARKFWSRYRASGDYGDAR